MSDNLYKILIAIFVIVIVGLCGFIGYNLISVYNSTTGNTSKTSSTSFSTTSKSLSTVSTANSMTSANSSSTNTSTTSKSSATVSSSSTLKTSTSMTSTSSSSVAAGALKQYFFKTSDDPMGVNPTATVRSTTETESLDKWIAAFTNVLNGPNAAEQANGLKRTWSLTGDSTCPNSWWWMTWESGSKLYVKICKDQIGIGTGFDAELRKTLEFTAKEYFPSSTIVILNKNDQCFFNTSGLNQCGQ